MRTVTVTASSQYQVMIQKGILRECGNLISEIADPCTVAIIADDKVDALYGNIVHASLMYAGFSVSRFTFPHGEASKNPAILEEILEFLAAQEFTRSDRILALGGGVTGDLAGFAAAVYLRGISFIQVPTTLLAAVDSSVGGKTGINLKGGKNLAGAFHQPAMVICDPEVFLSLSEEEFRNGLSEMLKYGVIGDPGLFEKLESGRYGSPREDSLSELEEMIETCVCMKRDIVAEDEFDTGRRQLLNLGHTLGHAIEKESHYEISHGQAVAMGMYLMAKAAERAELCPEGVGERIRLALERNGLPWKCDFSPGEIARSTLSDKKRRGDTIHFIFPRKIGSCSIVPVSVGAVRDLVSDAMGEDAPQEENPWM